MPVGAAIGLFVLLQRCDAFLRLALNLRTFSGNDGLSKSFRERKLDITSGQVIVVSCNMAASFGFWLGLPIAPDPPIGGQ